MNNNIQVFYGQTNLFAGIAPTPFIYSEQEFVDYKTKWNQITNLTMEGQLTGKYVGQISNQELNNSLELLLSRLNTNHKSLRITENNQNLLDVDVAIIDNIKINDSQWYGVLPFTLNFTIYQENLFSDFYGVTNPSEVLSFTEETDEILSLSHSIEAKGFKTNSNAAIDNAKSWVLSRTGTYNQVIPILVNSTNGSNFLLESVKENVDRFNNTYKWEGTYKKSRSLNSPKPCFLNYTVDISSGIKDGYVKVELNGSLERNNINILRDEYSKINFYDIANNTAQEVYATSLNTKPLNKTTTEFPNENKITFGFSYNNDYSPDVINNYTVKITQDAIKNIATVTLNTDITAKYGDVQQRWEKVSDFYNNEFDAYSLAKIEYEKEIGNKNLYNKIQTESVTFDEFNAKITYVASWTDKKQAFSDDVLNLQSKVTYTPGLNIYAPNTSAYVAKEHNVQNLKCSNAGTLDITVSAASKPNPNISINSAIQAVNSEISRIKNSYGINSTSFIKDRSSTINSDLKSISIQETWLLPGGDIYGV